MRFDYWIGCLWTGFGIIEIYLNGWTFSILLVSSIVIWTYIFQVESLEDKLKRSRNTRKKKVK
jgi:hypothetical protein